MKKVFAILAIFGFMAANSFADTKPINDNTGAVTTKTASSTFSCKVIVPVSITASDAVDLGVFVINGTTAYTQNNGVDFGKLTFTIKGEPLANISVTAGTNNGKYSTAGIATIATTPSTLPTFIAAHGDGDAAGFGSASFTVTPTGVTATAQGTTTLTCEYNVAYTSI
jgi:hypothetical protein